MPFGSKPTCAICSTIESAVWRKGENNTSLCNACFMKDENSNGKDSDENGKGNGEEILERRRRAVGSTFVGTIRKSARLKPSKYRGQERSKAFATKGKSRRVIFKKNVIRAPLPVATPVTSEYLFHDEMYYQVGDVVSVMDHDGGIFYAQLRGFLHDQYMEKSAIITWLLPTSASPPDTFDPSTYILGPEEELPRKMDCFEFVCHTPSEYFRNKNAPYPTLTHKPELGYIWTSLGPQIKPVPTFDELFGLKEPKSQSPSKEKREKAIARERKGQQEKERKEKERRDIVKEKRVARRERAEARRERVKSEIK